MSNIGWISDLTDAELFAKLKENGVTTPVTASTRKILEKKLAKLLGLIDSSSPSSDSGRTAVEYVDDDLDSSVGNTSERNWEDNVRHRGRQGNDTFGNSFYMEEVDAKPQSQIRNLRRKELDELDKQLKEQEAINRSLGGLDKAGTQSSRTALTVLAILVVIGVFLVISYMTQGESADELTRVPTVKVVPAEQL